MPLIQTIKVEDKFNNKIDDYDNATLTADGYFADLVQTVTDPVNQSQLINGVFVDNDAQYDLAVPQNISDDTAITMRADLTQTVYGREYTRRYVFEFTSTGIYDGGKYPYLSLDYQRIIRFVIDTDSTIDNISTRGGTWVWRNKQVSADSINVKAGDLVEVFHTEEDLAIDTTGMDIRRLYVEGNWTNDPIGVEKDVWYDMIININITDEKLINMQIVDDVDGHKVWIVNGQLFESDTIPAGSNVRLYHNDALSITKIDLRDVPYDNVDTILDDMEYASEKYMPNRTIDMVLVTGDVKSCHIDTVDLNTLLDDLSSNKIYTDIIQVDPNITITE